MSVMKNKMNQNIEVSIIMPSFNKFPLNLFALYSLENQTFNPGKMEVILIDDASTDQTEEKLKDYSPRYHFKYIRSNEKLGRAKGRNLGIHTARGNILIFLDAEMITEPDFVENHYHYHQSKNNVIVTGAMHSKALYSCIYPEFIDQKVEEIIELTKRNQEIYMRLEEFKHPVDRPYPLLEKSDIERETYKEISFQAYPWFEQIPVNFNENLEGFAFPWMAFLTGNLSIRKDLILQAGAFDEEFIHYGYEDWELGYRLYKMGAKYIASNELVTYHQEHPVGQDKWKEAIGNYGLFTIKHHDVDILILGIELTTMTDLLTMSNILNEYKIFVDSNPDNFHYLAETFLCILETIILLLEVDIRHFNILGAAGFSSADRIALQEDVNELESTGNYPNLTKFFRIVLTS